MVWITPARVSVLVRTNLDGDEWIDELIDHCQGLAELEIGAQTEPVSAGLQAVLAQIVARFWQAGESARINPAGLSAEGTGPFTIQDRLAGVAGLGLTNRERDSLRKAFGKGGFWVQGTSRGETLETAPIHGDIAGRERPSTDSLIDVVDGEPAPWFPEE